MPKVNSAFDRPGLWAEISDREISFFNTFNIQIVDGGEKQNPLFLALQPQYFVCITVCTWLTASWSVKLIFQS